MGGRRLSAIEPLASRVEELKCIAGEGTPEERVHNLAVYFDALYFGGPPPPPPEPRSLQPLTLRQRGVLLLRLRRCNARTRQLYQEERAREAASTKETA